MLFLGCSAPWRELVLSVLDWTRDPVVAPRAPTLSRGLWVLRSCALGPPSVPAEVALTANPVVAVAMPDPVCSVPSLGICPPLSAVYPRIVRTSSC